MLGAIILCTVRRKVQFFALKDSPLLGSELPLTLCPRRVSPAVDRGQKNKK